MNSFNDYNQLIEIVQNLVNKYFIENMSKI